MFEPILMAPDFGAPTPIVIGILVIVIGLLILRFIVKTALTLVKIAVLVFIGVAIYLGVTFVMDALA